MTFFRRDAIGTDPDPEAPAAKEPVKCSKCDCPKLKIEINFESEKNDLILVQPTFPEFAAPARCRIRTEDKRPRKIHITLQNPDDSLRFITPTFELKALSLEVPGDGSWVEFQISGKKGSNAIGDVIIQAFCKHEKEIVKKRVTVVWFDEAHLDIDVGVTYKFFHNDGGDMIYKINEKSGNESITFLASAKIKPDGVQKNAPQIQRLRIGFMQNTFPTRERAAYYGLTGVTSSKSAPPAGATVEAPGRIKFAKKIDVVANDCENPNAKEYKGASVSTPLYDKPGLGVLTFSPDSLKPPLNCKKGGVAMSFDRPRMSLGYTANVDERTVLLADDAIGRYKFEKATYQDNFRTWAVGYDTVTGSIWVIKERVWRINLESDHGPQSPTFEAETAPGIPVLEPYSLDLVIQQPYTRDESFETNKIRYFMTERGEWAPFREGSNDRDSEF